MPLRKPKVSNNLVEYARANDGELPFSGKSQSPQLTGRLKSNTPQIPMWRVLSGAFVLGVIVLGFLAYTLRANADNNVISNEEQVLIDYLAKSTITPANAETLMAQRIASCQLSADSPSTDSVDIVGATWNAGTQKYNIASIGTLTDKDNFVIYQLANLNDWYYIDALPSANMRFAYIPSIGNLSCTAL